MDPIVAQLNSVAQQKVGSLPDVKIQPGQNGESSPFQQTFDSKMTDRMLTRIREDYGMNPANQMKALNAEDIHIETKSTELGRKDLEPNQQFFSTFKEMNRDLLSLDSAIETLTTPGLKISPRQLLALQAGVANTTLMAESFSRFTDAMARGIQTIVQTQVG